MSEHIKLKILVIGESGVGKSSLMLRFTDDKFDKNEQPTIGVDFRVRNIEIDGQKIYLQIWDTAGQERFRTLIPSYYRDATGCILVYDISNMASFQKLDSWIEELEVNTNRNIVKMIIGNKIDLQDNMRKVDRETGKKFAKQQRALFLETSAANNTNVQMAFEELVKKILEDNIFDDQNGMMRSDFRLTSATENTQEPLGGGSCGGYCGR